MSVSYFPNSLSVNKVFVAFLMALTLMLAGCGAGSESSEAGAQVVDSDSETGDETNDAGNDDPVDEPEEPEQPAVLNLVSQPGNSSINEGDSYTFTVSVQNDSPITVTWYRNGSPIQTSSSTSYTTSSAGTYDCSITDGESTVDCDSFTLSVVIAQYVTIMTQPSNQMVNEGVDVNMAVVASGSSGLNYQWYFDGAPISGANAATLSLDSISMADDGEYYVVITSGSASTTSNVVSVSVSATLADALITWNRPVQRSDDTDLAESEIESYEIYYSDSAEGQLQKIDTVDASDLDYVASGLEMGTHYFSLVTVDTSGLKSELSSPVSVTIQ
jgi:hypothetical protein